MNYARLHQALDTCPFHRDRARMLADYFKSSSVDNCAWAAFLLLGGQLPRILTSAQIQTWLLEELSLPDWLVEESREAVGDSAETAALLAELLQPEGFEPPSSSLEPPRGLAEWIEGHLLPLQTLRPAEQRDRVVGWWKSLALLDASFLHHLLIARYQTPVPRRTVEEALALAYDLPRERVSLRLENLNEGSHDGAGFAALRQPRVFAGLVGIAEEISPEPLFDFAIAPLETTAPTEGVFEPHQTFELDAAEAVSSTFAQGNCLAIPSRGGPRARLERRAGKTSLWVLRQLGGEPTSECVNARFPELVQAAACLPDGTAIEGELQPRLAAEKRLARARRKTTGAGAKSADAEPIRFIAQDLCGDEGVPISRGDDRHVLASLRHERLRAILPRSSAYLSLTKTEILASAAHHRRLLELLAGARAGGGTDGYLLVPASSGARYYVKAPQRTIDAVLLYVENGQNGLSGCNFGLWDEDRLVPLGRVAFENLGGDLAETRQSLEEWARAHERERFGPVRAVDPVQVFELGFDDIERSPRHRAGFTLRAPSILRWKKGVDPKQAGTIESLKSQLRDS
jgi:DNA ligase-1